MIFYYHFFKYNYYATLLLYINLHNTGCHRCKMCVVVHNYNELFVFLNNACLLWLLYNIKLYTTRMKEEETIFKAPLLYPQFGL